MIQGLACAWGPHRPISPVSLCEHRGKPGSLLKPEKCVMRKGSAVMARFCCYGKGLLAVSAAARAGCFADPHLNRADPELTLPDPSLNPSSLKKL